MYCRDANSLGMLLTCGLVKIVAWIVYYLITMFKDIPHSDMGGLIGLIIISSIGIVIFGYIFYTEQNENLEE